ncbi:LOW QUALITY PROTEIN: sodium-dependent transporter [Geomicrobium sp. JCM 19038]|nr:LOW QUALITY PROTEIN: sodium-dependent transporter [Geomicrobium sp. JCM 19038]
MKATFITTWNSLWRQHNRTKGLLNIFSYKKDIDKAAEQRKTKEEAATKSSSEPPSSPNQPKQAYSKAQMIGLLLGPTLFILTMAFFNPEGLASEARAVLAVTLWIATWWVTEALPIPATSLLPLILLPTTGALEGSAVASSYGDDVIFLFLGGFFIATAMEKWNLHKRMALLIISLIGTSTQRILLGFMVATGFISMWVSNTAAVMMMIPMGLAITAQVASALKDKPEEKDFPKFEKSLIFGIGYAGTIGGVGTLIGTPPNIILAGQMREIFGIEISFATWMLFGIPVVAIMLLFTWFYLGRVAFKTEIKSLPGGKAVIQDERKSLARPSYEEWMVGIVFLFAAFMWVTRSFFWDYENGSSIFKVVMDLQCSLLYYCSPSRQVEQKAVRILVWSDSRDIPWGVLLLFGGGLAIAQGFTASGLSDWLGQQLTVLDGFNLLIIIAAATIFIMILTEITSNTATATMILPVVAALAIALDVHPFALMIPCAMAANMAFMLPVGTPPNAIMFGTGKLKIIEMVKTGFFVNIVATIIIIFGVYYAVPLVWGIDLTSFPASLQ